jgi:hypothetical protein
MKDPWCFRPFMVFTAFTFFGLFAARWSVGDSPPPTATPAAELDHKSFDMKK